MSAAQNPKFQKVKDTKDCSNVVASNIMPAVGSVGAVVMAVLSKTYSRNIFNIYRWRVYIACQISAERYDRCGWAICQTKASGNMYEILRFDKVILTKQY